MAFPFRIRTGWWWVAATLLVFALVFLFGDWPVPAWLKKPVLAEVSARLRRPIEAAEMRWIPIRGVVLRDASIRTEWPTARAKEAWVLGIFPFRPTRFLLVDVDIYGGRDETGALRVPWPRAEPHRRKPELIEIRGGRFFWKDARFGWEGVLHRLEGTLSPINRAGDMTALFGDTEPSPVSARWEAGDGRVTADSVQFWRLPWLPAPLRRGATPVDLALDWHDRGDSIRFLSVIHQGDDARIRLELDAIRSEDRDTMDFTGRFSTDLLAIALKGTSGRGTFDLEVWPAETGLTVLGGDRMSRLPRAETGGVEIRGKIAVRERARRWSSVFDLRAAALPGSVLDPFITGGRLRGPAKLELSGSYPVASTVVRLDARNGRLEGVRGFANFARRTGLKRFHTPSYEQLRIRATVGPSRINVGEAYFEGGGLGIRFHGNLSARSISGKMKALLSDEIVQASPELSRYRLFLDRENGRMKIDFVVSGPRDSPELKPVLPPAPIMFFRGVGRMFAGGGNALRQGLTNLFD